MKTSYKMLFYGLIFGAGVGLTFFAAGLGLAVSFCLGCGVASTSLLAFYQKNNHSCCK